MYGEETNGGNKMSASGLLRVKRAYRNAVVCYKKMHDRGCLPQGLFDVLTQGKYKESFWRSALFASNDLYGIEKALLDYSNCQTSIYAPSEHGVYFGPYINRDETDATAYPLTLTFGPQRAMHLGALADMPALQIGPYIYYADKFLNQVQMESIKEKLGKILLVFPMHSIETVRVRFDDAELFAKVAELEEEHSIDTTFYCLYFHDVEQGLAQRFEHAGKRVVCAGHRMDPDFLPRLKSLILLSDMTASNAIGTHIGYSEVLGRRHVLLETKSESTVEPELLARGDEFKKKKNLEIEEVRRAFEDKDEVKRKDVLEKYWGINQIREPEEMKILLLEIASVYREMHRKNLNAKEAIECSCALLRKAGTLDFVKG